MRRRRLRNAAAALALLSAPALTACVTYLPAAPPTITIPVPAAPVAPAAPVVPAAPHQVPQPSPARTSGCVASYETAQSRVDICGSAGSLYYYGSSDSGSITLRAYPSGSWYVTETNDGHVYHVDDSALTIARYGTIISSQSVLSSS
ncbi:hypothetical protein E1202_14940 [Saccharopolyspora karakumensis]|uniref:Uncharacterized protein n=1 Tax=Saccharopolyspora karakumensis TaxID=2530386 RepID=A0A4R5BV11_9PSEU|nr:hypothetical protein [Saccharopolyspora karakumensis]TDD88082.1 hypothetical protein E1202_14940 [Saccharopolyspora karakumensis]